MGAVGDLELLARACGVLLPVVDEYERKHLTILAETGRTSAVKGLRAARLQRAIVAVGMFSLFEAALKDQYGWKDPIGALEKVVAPDWLANNVLKHGAGASLSKLVQRRSSLDFSVRSKDEPYFEEGVVNEIHSRIDITNPFVLACADLIERVSTLVEKEARK